LSDRPTLEQLLEVQEQFGLPGPALVEKDWYVMKALAAVAAVDTVYGDAPDFNTAMGSLKALGDHLKKYQT
jgi:hypothetical protein